MTCGLRSLRWPHIILWAIVIAVAIALFASLAFASPDPVKDTRQIMAGTVTTTKIKNEYLSGARDSTTPFKGALSAYKAVRAAEVPAPTPVPVPTPTPTPAPIPAGTYDVSIGLGVDANGFASLPLRTGAHHYFVNSASGSDANGCAAAQAPTAPLATVKAGLGCALDGEGDQILVAEGTTNATTIPSLAFRKGGYSLAYPFVIQSYDPADPLNDAKYGRATGGNRPVFTGNNTTSTWIFGGTRQSFIAIRGLDINPGNISGQNIGAVDVGQGILFENNLLRFTGVALQNTSGIKQPHWIIRGNAIYGTWDATTATAGQGIYADGSDSLTIEDNVLYHIGWKIGASRTDTLANGGATQFRHPIYQQVPTDAVVRRNLIVDGSADGGSFRGNITHTENVIIDCPIAASLGGGVAYDKGRPNGVDIQSSYNAIIGSDTIPDSGAAGWGASAANGKLGSAFHHNLLVRSPVGSQAYLNSAQFNQPSNMDFHHNISFGWSPSGQSAAPPTGIYAAQIFSTFHDNFWDDPTSGSNLNISSLIAPNPYTAAQFYVALGFADKAAFITYAINHPEAHVQRNARSLLFLGYGMPAN